MKTARPLPDPIRDDEYTLPQIAGFLDRSLRTVCNWVDGGRLPARRALDGTHVRRVARIADARTLDDDQPRRGRVRPHLRPERRGKLNQRPAGDGTPTGLTDHERDCLRATCELGTAGRAAGVLGLSVHTVRTALRRGASKLGLYAPGDRSMRCLPLACYHLGRFDSEQGIEPGWFADDDVAAD